MRKWTLLQIQSRRKNLVCPVRLQSITSNLREAQQRRALLRWLCPFSSSENYDHAQQLLIPGTGQWLLDSDSHARWCSNDSLLWISGSRKSMDAFKELMLTKNVAGTGKTMLLYVKRFAWNR
jgi:hypothetical protein